MLNPNHKRVLSETFREVEDELRDLRRLLLRTEEERIFLHIVDDLTQEEKQVFNVKIGQMMDLIIRLKSLFELKPGQRVLRWIARATAVYLSVQLEQVMSDKMEGYGEVAPEDKQTLDPKLNEMLSIFREMKSTV
jgi:hypothetical protein